MLSTGSRKGSAVTSSAATGRKVLEGLAKGRRQRQEQAAELRRAVLQIAGELSARGLASYGMAGRIARRLPGIVTERHVRRILCESLKKSDNQNECPAGHAVACEL